MGAAVAGSPGRKHDLAPIVEPCELPAKTLETVRLCVYSTSHSC
jgi:hypothetical protein